MKQNLKNGNSLAGLPAKVKCDGSTDNWDANFHIFKLPASILE